jgi:phage-related minor tail protein
MKVKNMSDVGTPFAAQDLNQVRVSLDTIGVSADKVSKSLASAFSSAIISSKSFDQTLQGVLQSLSKMALNASLKPLQEGISSLLSSALSGLGGGGGGGGAGVTPFAEGGIVSRPTYFGSGGGVGLMGERGAEAILPLSRGPDGKLGLASQGGGGRAASVTINISSPDVDSFRRSQVQITGALARAVAQGQRGL